VVALTGLAQHDVDPDQRGLGLRLNQRIYTHSDQKLMKQARECRGTLAFSPRIQIISRTRSAFVLINEILALTKITVICPTDDARQPSSCWAMEADRRGGTFPVRSGLNADIFGQAASPFRLRPTAHNARVLREVGLPFFSKKKPRSDRTAPSSLAISSL